MSVEVREELFRKIAEIQAQGEEIDSPPIFELMEVDVVSYDLEKKVLVNKFPVKKEYMNPYKIMQGGMIAAAIDNTIGPLSMLVAKANITRNLDVKYSKPVELHHKHILVTARYLREENGFLLFDARVTTMDGKKLAQAKSRHWPIAQ